MELRTKRIRSRVYLCERIYFSFAALCHRPTGPGRHIWALFVFSPIPVDNVLVHQKYFALSIACSSSSKPGPSNIPSRHHAVVCMVNRVVGAGYLPRSWALVPVAGRDTCAQKNRPSCDWILARDCWFPKRKQKKYRGLKKKLPCSIHTHSPFNQCLDC